MTFGPGFASGYNLSPPGIIEQAVKPFASLQQAASQAYIQSSHAEDKWLVLHDELHARFREGGFKTWEECCQATYKMSRRDVLYRRNLAIERLAATMLDKENLKNLGVVVGKNPTGESNPYLNPEKIKHFAAEADERALASVEKSRTSPAKPQAEQPIVDKVGHPIPAHAVQYWNRATEVQHVLSALSDLRGTVRKANEAGDPLWCAFDAQDLLLAFDALYMSVSNFMPYAVCKKCDGAETKTICSMCHGTGLINKTTYGFNKS